MAENKENGTGGGAGGSLGSSLKRENAGFGSAGGAPGGGGGQAAPQGPDLQQEGPEGLSPAWSRPTWRGRPSGWTRSGRGCACTGSEGSVLCIVGTRQVCPPPAWAPGRSPQRRPWSPAAHATGGTGHGTANTRPVHAPVVRHVVPGLTWPLLDGSHVFLVTAPLRPPAGAGTRVPRAQLSHPPPRGRDRGRSCRAGCSSQRGGQGPLRPGRPSSSPGSPRPRPPTRGLRLTPQAGPCPERGLQNHAQGGWPLTPRRRGDHNGPLLPQGHLGHPAWCGRLPSE